VNKEWHSARADATRQSDWKQRPADRPQRPNTTQASVTHLVNIIVPWALGNKNRVRHFALGLAEWSIGDSRGSRGACPKPKVLQGPGIPSPDAKAQTTVRRLVY